MQGDVGASWGSMLEDIADDVHEVELALTPTSGNADCILGSRRSGGRLGGL